jgi:hypothetical protein
VFSLLSNFSTHSSIAETRSIPGMADAYNMVHVAQGELQELVCKYSPGVCKAKKTVICEDCPQPHRSSMQDSFVAQTAKTSMTVYDLDPFAYDDIAKHREEGEDGWEGSLAVDDEEWYIVDLEAIREVAHPCSPGICMSDDYDLVSAIDEFLGLISRGVGGGECGSLRWITGTCDSLHLLRSMRRHSRTRDMAHTGLRVEVVADHAVVC